MQLRPQRLRQRTRWTRLPLWALSMVMFPGAHALELDTGNEDLKIRFDNTVKASTQYRLQDAQPALANSTRQIVPGVAASAFPQALNLNAGDDNFRRQGIVSKRLDLLSEFDLVYRKDLGLRLSAAAWYDAAYSGTTSATDPGNGQAVYNQFSSATRDLAGRKAEVLDAFVFGALPLANGNKATARLGRHALQYGESLFFGDNGIARAQGPIDIWKLMSSPNAQFKEIIRPVPQVSAQLPLSSDVSIGGYYQFRWEADRMAPAGSYFSNANTIWGGSGLNEVVGSAVLRPGADVRPPDSGQFGAQLKWRLEETDLGFYAARYHDKAGQLFSQLNVTGGQGQWYYAFPQAVKTVGASASHSLGNTNVSVETSLRQDMPLVNSNIVYANVGPTGVLATGKTAHLNLSWLSSLGPSFVAREATFLGEIAWNRLLSKRDPQGHLDPLRTRDATALQMVFSPSYRQVLPGLDLSVPLGLRYVLDGNSAITGQSWGPKGTGSATFGVEGTYEGVWQFALNYTRFLGGSAPLVNYTPLLTGGTPTYTTGNPLGDRDFVSLSIRRTF
ncbi:DUF1302 family protein [Curvibacter sp. HBC61]|uniref:DUF1302 family protein n=1 Tax=Curvibacter cyanobacteriorum TaxID=3026422 RepID=A0ABT5MXT9_9BURK|nr:DUF1302 family protein [Curvibacter sp. HBC61]MDD0838876.1 DUF1302 family protein [Curvibacter sp. HBC61]